MEMKESNKDREPANKEREQEIRTIARELYLDLLRTYYGVTLEEVQSQQKERDKEPRRKGRPLSAFPKETNEEPGFRVTHFGIDRIQIAFPEETENGKESKKWHYPLLITWSLTSTGEIRISRNKIDPESKTFERITGEVALKSLLDFLEAKEVLKNTIAEFKRRLGSSEE
ncbi:hypothetical protein IPG41_01975 [Candidatus Peregrinibacteria bacterium]|nr:MAG: hypothetical protein IPG41_01975 [Candidatus Peregrinibacteria bacterium]